MTLFDILENRFDIVGTTTGGSFAFPFSFFLAFFLSFFRICFSLSTATILFRFQYAAVFRRPNARYIRATSSSRSIPQKREQEHFSIQLFSRVPILPYGRGYTYPLSAGVVVPIVEHLNTFFVPTKRGRSKVCIISARSSEMAVYCVDRARSRTDRNHGVAAVSSLEISVDVVSSSIRLLVYRFDADFPIIPDEIRYRVLVAEIRAKRRDEKAGGEGRYRGRRRFVVEERSVLRFRKQSQKHRGVIDKLPLTTTVHTERINPGREGDNSSRMKFAKQRDSVRARCRVYKGELARRSYMRTARPSN